eukprot:SAG25_NODE_425_length_8162_cov_5.814089_8_plen_67_part_00
MDYHRTERHSQHIVVLRGDSFHRLEVVADDGRIAPEAAIEAALQVWPCGGGLHAACINMYICGGAG